MISVISVFNNRDILNRYLLRSLRRQSADHETVLIDNTKGQFHSAAEALNYGAQDATGRYLMFVHQDVSLSHQDWLESVEETLGKLPCLGAAGVAGAKDGEQESYSNLEHSSTPCQPCAHRVETPVEVLTLDECVFITPTDIFKAHKFSAESQLGWHLYGVELCLRLRRSGLSSYVLPQPVYHWGGLRGSTEHLSEDYFATLKRLMTQYRDFGQIATTCGNWHTKTPIRWQRSKARARLKGLKSFLRSPPREKIRRIIAYSAWTTLGRRVIKKIDPQLLYEYGRCEYYRTLREKMPPLTRPEGDSLTASDINEHLVTLRILTRELHLKRVLELGVATGQSTLAFLLAAKELGGQVVSMDIEPCPVAKQAVQEAGLSPYWTFIQGDDLEHEWHSEIDHLFIDTSHGYDHTLAELEKYEPWVRSGGILTMHDTLSFPGVQRAIDRYLIGRAYLRQYSFHNNHGLAVIVKGAST